MNDNNYDKNQAPQYITNRSKSHHFFEKGITITGDKTNSNILKAKNIEAIFNRNSKDLKNLKKMVKNSKKSSLLRRNKIKQGIKRDSFLQNPIEVKTSVFRQSSHLNTSNNSNVIKVPESIRIVKEDAKLFFDKKLRVSSPNNNQIMENLGNYSQSIHKIINSSSLIEQLPHSSRIIQNKGTPLPKRSQSGARFERNARNPEFDNLRQNFGSSLHVTNSIKINDFMKKNTDFGNFNDFLLKSSKKNINTSTGYLNPQNTNTSQRSFSDTLRENRKIKRDMETNNYILNNKNKKNESSFLDNNSNRLIKSYLRNDNRRSLAVYKKDDNTGFNYKNQENKTFFDENLSNFPLTLTNQKKEKTGCMRDISGSLPIKTSENLSSSNNFLGLGRKEVLTPKESLNNYEKISSSNLSNLSNSGRKIINSSFNSKIDFSNKKNEENDLKKDLEGKIENLAKELLNQRQDNQILIENGRKKEIEIKELKNLIKIEKEENEEKLKEISEKLKIEEELSKELKKKIKELNESFEEERNDLLDMNLDLEDSLKKLRAEIENTQKSGENSKKLHEEIKKLKTINQEFFSKNQFIIEENTSLKEKLKNIKKVHISELKQFKEQICSLTDICHKYQSRLDTISSPELEKEIKKIEKLKNREISILKEENQDLRVKLENIDKDYKERIKELENFQSDAKESVQRSEEDRRAMYQDLGQLEKHYNEIKRKLDEEIFVKRKYELEVFERREEVRKLKNEVEEVRRVNFGLREKLAESVRMSKRCVKSGSGGGFEEMLGAGGGRRERYREMEEVGYIMFYFKSFFVFYFFGFILRSLYFLKIEFFEKLDF